MESVPKLSTPEEEIAYLRAQVARKEAELAAHEQTETARMQIVREQLNEHRAAPDEVLAPEMRMSDTATDTEAARLLAEFDLGDSEQSIAGLQKTMEEKGIKNALAILEKMRDPRTTDDFHRYLVGYLAAGLPARGLDERAPRFQALKMGLYEIALPEHKKDDQGNRTKPLKELISGMEQFYAGLQSVEDAAIGEPHYYALELAVPANSAELQFYAAIPNAKKNLFEKQLLAIFPDAHLVPQPYDYNVFTEGGTSLASTAYLPEHPALPLKDYGDFDYDPINALTNAFAKIENSGEGAAIQFIIEPRGERHVQHYRKILHALRKGEKKGAAFSTPETALGELARDFGKLLFTNKPKDEVKKKEEETRQIEANKSYIEQVEKKIAAPIVGATVRLVVSSPNAGTAGQILGEIESAFNQFGNTEGNRIAFHRADERHAQSVLDEFSFRLPAAAAIPLSLRELTAMYHFPPEGIESSPHLKQARATHAPAPAVLPHEGALLGI
ncbi:MAG: hypothetical protein WC030_03200, partial [Candidatus Paceibacterota bacterium]